ncbi:GNAT family N-acetyltransferase [Aeromicrobium terrae]|uniref:GNAT family N-acetyltransferase n=1 Tax=Aeromicrobium terrae TaxID=2498846 RepID=UPI001650ABEE|nr:GNAT family N-acetyltransferase [Aeromicrobium terrae]
MDVCVRLMRAEDLDRVADLYCEAATEDIHDRFFTIGRHIVETHLADLASVDGPRCLVAVGHDDQIVGVVEMASVGDHAEEVALLVASSLHHHGVGTTLLAAAVEDARARGVCLLVAEVLASNHLMLDVFANAGATLARDGGEVTVTLPITQGDVHA